MSGSDVMSSVRQGIVTATNWLNNLVISFKNWNFVVTYWVILLMMAGSHTISTNTTKCIHKHGRIAYWSLATFNESSGYNTWQPQTALDVTHQLTAQCKTAPCPTAWQNVRRLLRVWGWNNKKTENRDPTSSEGMMTAWPPDISSGYLTFFSIRQSPPQSPYT